MFERLLNLRTPRVGVHDPAAEMLYAIAVVAYSRDLPRSFGSPAASSGFGATVVPPARKTINHILDLAAQRGLQLSTRKRLVKAAKASKQLSSVSKDAQAVVALVGAKEISAGAARLAEFLGRVEDSAVAALASLTNNSSNSTH